MMVRAEVAALPVELDKQRLFLRAFLAEPFTSGTSPEGELVLHGTTLFFTVQKLMLELMPVYQNPPDLSRGHAYDCSARPPSSIGDAREPLQQNSKAIPAHSFVIASPRQFHLIPTEQFTVQLGLFRQTSGRHRGTHETCSSFVCA